MTYTPGPWHAGGSIVVTESGQTITEVQLPNPRDYPDTEKLVAPQDLLDAIDTVRANTRLIAAAPDLLGALEKTLFPLKTAALLGSHGAKNAFIRAEKAIAKAKGAS
jgi:hypothetical protein